jgi:hypothetical protein
VIRFLITAFACAMANVASAQDAAELAKQLANPIANLVAVPFQLNWDGPVGPNEDTRSLINFQPVMPFEMSKDWNLIARAIVPQCPPTRTLVPASSASVPPESC